MNRLLGLGALALCLTSSLTAQFTVTLPANAAGVEGSTANAFPWGYTGTAWPGLRIQAFYDTFNLTSQGVNNPILITGIRWRCNGNTAPSGGTHGVATVALASAAVDYSVITTNYLTNQNPDYTIVYSGAVTVTPAQASTPGAWYVDVQFPGSPFLYDPTLGNDLIIDTDSVLGNWSGGGSATQDIAGAGSMSSRVYSSSFYPLGNGTTQNHGVVVEIDYMPAGSNFATMTPFGTGCNSVPGASFYEHFLPGAFDLTAPVDNMTLLHTGGDYLALSGLGTWIAPTAAATPLALGDDSEAAITLSSPMPVGRSGSTNSLMVCSNGFVSTGSNGTGFSPNTNTFLNNGQTGWYCWHDYNPASTGSGAVVHEEIGGVLVITWDGVHSYGQTVPEYLQFQFDLATGNCTMVWQTISNLGNDHLIGFSEGGASADPGSIDLSTLLPLTIPGAAIFEMVPLGLSADGRPILGTTVTMTVDNVPPGSPFGAVIYGLTQHNPGIDLTSIGMPGCWQYCSQDSVSLVIAPGNSFPSMFNVPISTSFAGVHIQVQGACYNPTAGLNALGALSSRGIDLGLDIN